METKTTTTTTTTKTPKTNNEVGHYTQTYFRAISQEVSTKYHTYTQHALNGMINTQMFGVMVLDT
mgnify:CR=1 FL=1